MTQNEHEILALLNEFDERNQLKLIGKMELIVKNMQNKLANGKFDGFASANNTKQNRLTLIKADTAIIKSLFLRG